MKSADKMSEKTDPKLSDQEPVVVLTIAGSDSCGGAGVQADLKTFMAHGVYGACVITAVTAQNTTGVQAIDVVGSDVVAAQLSSVLSDLTVRAIKIGMVGSVDNVAAVVSSLKPYQNQMVVLDTPLISGTGSPLGDNEVCCALVEELFPLATVITPNLREAALFLNCEPARSVDEMIGQASALLSLGAKAVLLKGGHLPEFSDESSLIEGQAEAFDVLDLGEGPIVLSENWVDTIHTHGTGCCLASAITAFLAKGETLEQAVRLAKVWLTFCLQNSSKMGIGSGPGPLNIALLAKT